MHIRMCIWLRKTVPGPTVPKKQNLNSPCTEWAMQFVSRAGKQISELEGNLSKCTMMCESHILLYIYILLSLRLLSGTWRTYVICIQISYLSCVYVICMLAVSGFLQCAKKIPARLWSNLCQRQRLEGHAFRVHTGQGMFCCLSQTFAVNLDQSGVSHGA
jgi:hypothetical protein